MHSPPESTEKLFKKIESSPRQRSEGQVLYLKPLRITSFRGSEATEESEISRLHYVPARNDNSLYGRVSSLPPRVTNPSEP